MICCESTSDPSRISSVGSIVVDVLASRIDGPVKSLSVTTCPVVGSVATTVESPADAARDAGAFVAIVPGGAAEESLVSEPNAFATSNGVTKPTLEVVPTIDSFNAPAKPVSKSAFPVVAY